jgi:hypothetical protein
MEKSFLVESKIFVFLVLDGVSRLRVGEKRKSFSGEIVISPQCSEWLASMLEILLGFREDQEFIKSFREGSKILIAWRGGNHTGHFLEAAVFGVGWPERAHFDPGKPWWVGLAQILRRAEKGRCFPFCQNGLRSWVPVCVSQ